MVLIDTWKTRHHQGTLTIFVTRCHEFPVSRRRFYFQLLVLLEGSPTSANETPPAVIARRNKPAAPDAFNGLYGTSVSPSRAKRVRRPLQQANRHQGKSSGLCDATRSAQACLLHLEDYLRNDSLSERACRYL